MKKRLTLFFFLCVTMLSVLSQGEGNNWYFGYFAGLNFSTDPPTILTDGHLTTGEGSASVSGKDGSLAFYTDGKFVWDANHNPMPNGNGGLLGSPSSTQSAVICPKPNTYNYGTKRYDNYFIITIDYMIGSGGVRYTEIDMTLNGGMGDVVVSNKNVLLFGTTTMEGANVAKHSNGCDFWIIGKPLGGNAVNAYQITATGVSLTPVVSNTGPNIGNGWGAIKVASDNSKICISSNGSGTNRTNVYNFNATTGVVSFLYNDNIGGYSSEFSPDSKILYATLLNDLNIYQYDLTTTTQAAFVASRQIIGTTANSNGYKMCGLQLAPNGKIYSALHGLGFLGVINAPNTLGTGCAFVDNGQAIAGLNTFSNLQITSSLGLPAFPSFFLTEPLFIQSSYLCFDDQTEFELSDTTGMTNVDWFWQPLGAQTPIVANSTDWKPTEQFLAAGDYEVMAVTYFPCFIDSIIDTITITNVNQVNLGNDTIFCDGNTLLLDAGAGYDYYFWHDGSINQTFTADTSGQYIVEVANVGENLVVNGDFESGNENFSSDYNYFVGGIQQGGYTITNLASQWGANCVDHTTGNGNLMIVDAACGTNGVPGGVSLWCNTINVSPNTDYIFSVWAANANSTPSTANIGFFINGTQIGGTLQTSSATCNWVELTQVWNSGSNTTIDLCLNELTFVCSGADFIIDDIYFAPLCKTADTINIVVGKIPYAEFSIVDSCEYNSVIFTDNSSIPMPESIVNWSWDIDNDGTEDYTIQNPFHDYLAGNYLSKLTVTSALGCQKDTIMPVLVYPKPQGNANFINNCFYDSLSFNDNSTVSAPDNITSIAWNFGDNGGVPFVQSSLSAPNHKYTTPGNYTVTEVLATNNGCYDTLYLQVEAFDVPTSEFTFSNACDQENVVFTDASLSNSTTISGYQWDYTTDGVFDSQTQNGNTTYQSAGTYNVSLEVTSVDGCKDTSSHSIIINPSPVVNFSGQNVCEGDQVVFSNTSAIATGTIQGYFWEFGNGNTSTQNAPSETYLTEGVFNVSLTATSDSGCVSNLTTNIDVYPNPNAQFITSNVCDGNDVNFTDFSSVSNQNTNNNITAWEWEFGDVNSSTSSGQFSNFLYPQSGDYTVTLNIVTNNGCVDTIQQMVTVYPNPDVSFISPNPQGCTELCVDFNNISVISSGTNASYLWSFGDGNASVDENPFNCFTNTTLNNQIFDISLSVTSDMGCVSVYSEPGMVTVYPTPFVDFDASTFATDIYHTEIDFYNNSLGGDNYLWSFDVLDSTIESDPSYVFPNQDSGVYNVCLFVESLFGCTNDTCKVVDITGVVNIYIPNTFTPNGDGVNDVFIPSLSGVSENEFSFMIFDRWGLLLLDTDNLSNARWDGTYKGMAVNEDTYVWKIYAKDKYSNSVISRTGTVTILR